MLARLIRSRQDTALLLSAMGRAGVLRVLARLVMDVAGKQQSIRHIPGPQGVRGRRSNNDLVRKELGWEPRLDLRQGLERTYPWISEQVRLAATTAAR